MQWQDHAIPSTVHFQCPHWQIADSHATRYPSAYYSAGILVDLISKVFSGISIEESLKESIKNFTSTHNSNEHVDDLVNLLNKTIKLANSDIEETEILYYIARELGIEETLSEYDLEGNPADFLEDDYYYGDGCAAITRSRIPGLFSR